MAHGRTNWHWLGHVVSGDCADITYYTDRRGRITAYPASPPKKSPTCLVCYQRDRWRRAAKLWGTLSLLDRARYREAARAASLAATGPGIWMWACCLKDKRPWRTLVARTGINLRSPPYL
jgi:hypothetical protein